MQVGLGNFDVVAEDMVKADFERRDIGALALALFHGSDDLLAVLAEVAQLVELGQHSKQIIASMEERERKRTNIASLKIRFNHDFGYYIEISKPNLHLAPADYERKQTLVNAERFTSPELKEYERKILAADERILEIERQLFIDLRSSIAGKAARLRKTACAIAQLDVLATFAKLATDRGYTRPEFNSSGELLIIAGRHPVI